MLSDGRPPTQELRGRRKGVVAHASVSARFWPAHTKARRRQVRRPGDRVMPSSARASAYRVGIGGAVATLFGIVLSGPRALVWLNAAHPQPDWTDAETFARHFH